MAIILASATTAASSSDFTLAAGESATLCIVHASLPDAHLSALVLVQYKSGSTYMTVGTLRYGQIAMVLSGAGTYRVYRPLTTGDPIAVDKT